MKQTVLFRRSYRKAERGVALLFALGILSVIIVTVLIFAKRSSTDLKVSSALSREIGSKMLAKTALSQAVMTMQYSAFSTNTVFSTPASAAAKAYSQDTTNGDFDWLWKMDIKDYPFEKTFNTASTNNEPVRWIYVTNGQTGSAERIIGRYAFRGIASNNLNLNAVANHDFCFTPGTSCSCSEKMGISAAELNLNPAKITISPDTSAFANLTNSGIKGKIYQMPEDLDKDFTFTKSNFWKYVFGQFLGVRYSDNQKEPDAWYGGTLDFGPGGGARKWDHFYKRFNLHKDLSSTTVDNIAKAAVRFYSDANWTINTATDTANTPGIPYLASWDSADTDTVNWDSNDNRRKQIIANLINYCSPDTLPAVSDVTPENWGKEGDGNIPHYTGNKRTWQLNECQAILQFTTVRGSAPKEGGWHNDGDGNKVVDWYYWDDMTLTPTLTLKGEAVKMYRDVIGTLGNGSLAVYGSITFKYKTHNFTGATGLGAANPRTAGTYSASTATYNVFSTLPSYTVSETTYKCIGIPVENANGYCTFKFVPTTDTGAASIAPGAISGGEGEGRLGRYVAASNAGSNDPDTLSYADIFEISDIKVDLKLVLQNANDGSSDPAAADRWDFAHITKDHADALSFSGSTLNYAVDFEVNDPRHNLRPEFWTAQESTETMANHTLGLVNSVFSAAAATDKDPELAVDPAWLGDGKDQHISTAYIRHAPMESLWELGAIHRAAPWQTINLKKPATIPSINAATDISAASIGTYTEGDYRILDQVTLQKQDPQPLTGVFGKVNLNSTDPCRDFVLDALVRGMKFRNNGMYASDSSVSTLGSGEGAVDPAATVSRLKAMGVSSKLFNRRSDIYASTSDTFWELFTASPAGGALGTDALQEQLIGRIINLTDALPSYDSAVVVVMAQTIQDLSGTFYPDLNEDGLGSGTLNDKAKMTLGYQRYNQLGTDCTSFPTPPAINSTNKPVDGITAAYGHYNLGADKITGECLLVAYLVYDKVNNKWRIAQVKYEE